MFHQPLEPLYLHLRQPNTHKGKNRRTLRGLPIPLPGSDYNFTKEHQRNSSSKEIKPASSMVVSVLVDPREGGDGDIDGMIGGPKSLSRVFVVVHVDSAKYVTYSYFTGLVCRRINKLLAYGIK
uniref:Uncharacterized protein n=1 Tax=Brassica campestris TaxID=3711 RepID=A0A3P5XYX8_BRACM|nr:unnamed protein product [Brassica rapa]